MKHTPTPWKIYDELGCGCREIGRWNDCADQNDPFCGKEDVCCTVGHYDDSVDLANASFIVRACNSHEVLVLALKQAIRLYEGMVHDEYDGTSMLDEMLSDIEECRAALKLAEEGR